MPRLTGVSGPVFSCVFPAVTARTPVYYSTEYIRLGFPGGSAGKESSCSVGDLGLIPGLGRSPGEGKGYPL